MRNFGFLFNAAGCALNAGLYAAWGDSWSLAGAIFCGFLALDTVVND